jgi:3-oxoacyl-[acyl-carrier-protein] synthase-1
MAGEGLAVVTGLGMVTSVGLCLDQSCASVRASLSRFQESDVYHHATAGPPEWSAEPLVVAEVPGIDPDEDRIRTLILSAVQDLIRNARLTRKDFAAAGLYASLPPASRPSKRLPDSPQTLSKFLDRPMAPEQSPQIFCSGHGGAFLALQAAIADIKSGRYQSCIVLAADSYFDAETLSVLLKARRLKGTDSSAGFIPGEAAAAILMESPRDARRRQSRVLAIIEAVGTAQEMKTVLSEEVCQGDGLSDAIRAAVAEAGGGAIDWIACDLNGERYRAAEWGYCQTRLHSILGGALKVWHPADCLGDVGAATGAVLIALVAQAFEKEYAPSERCLLWASSDKGERAAAVISRGLPKEKGK